MPLKRTISILFVTDNQKQPYGIKMGLFWFKLLIGAVIGGLIIFISGIFVYFKLVSIAMDYNNLQEKYTLSLRQNNQIVDLMKKFSQIQQMDFQIRQNLGLQLGIGETSPEGTESIEWDRSTAFTPEYSPIHHHPAAAMENPINLESFPTMLPVEGFITRGFMLSQHNAADDHIGIDIVAREGSSVAAAGDGIVLFSNRTYESGNSIIIDHGNGYLTFYKHNKRNLVSERQFVHRGEPIALLGNSGISSGPHLHFEIWKDGKPVDPRSFILNL